MTVKRDHAIGQGLHDVKNRRRITPAEMAALRDAADALERTRAGKAERRQALKDRGVIDSRSRAHKRRAIRFREVLKSYMKMKGVTAKQLELQTGVPEGKIRRWRSRGAVWTSGGDAGKVCDALGITDETHYIQDEPAAILAVVAELVPMLTQDEQDRFGELVLRHARGFLAVNGWDRKRAAAATGINPRLEAMFGGDTTPLS